MNHIVPVAFIDTSLMTANLLIRHKDHIKDGVMRLRDDDDLPILQSFKSAKVVFGRIRKALARDGVPPELGRAFIEVLAAGDTLSWRVEEDEYALEHDRLHLCLVPSPGAWLYAGGEMLSPGVGWLTFFNQRVLHSEANFGLVDRIHLVVYVRRPDQAA